MNSLPFLAYDLVYIVDVFSTFFMLGCPQASQVILELESFGLPFSRTPEAPYLMFFRGFHEFKGRVIAALLLATAVDILFVFSYLPRARSISEPLVGKA